MLDELASHVIRFHPACPFGPGQHHPCMVTLFRDIASDKPVAIQRTALRPDGGKIGRMTMASTAGASIKLSDDANVLYGLHLAEGFESALAAWQCGFGPIWAAGSKGSIASFPVLPESVQSITILMEPDAVAEVETCAHRWRAAGRETIIVSANAKDMNDAILEASP
jgi:putative DNA primase/helicase